MTPIERQFAELVGRVLGRRWFAMQQAGKVVEAETPSRGAHRGGSDTRSATVKIRGDRIAKHQRK
jgi:hypothetical protein